MVAHCDEVEADKRRECSVLNKPFPWGPTTAGKMLCEAASCETVNFPRPASALERVGSSVSA